MMRVSWLLCVALLAPVHATAGQPGDHPLLDLAHELESEGKLQKRAMNNAAEVRAAEHALEQARVPADADCARSLGASTFAKLHSDLGRAHMAGGDRVNAAAAFRRAHACRPRDADILRNLAEIEFDSRNYEAARAAIKQALDLEPREVTNHRIAGGLDFVAERWADAVTRFRYVASSDEDRNSAGYGQIMYWLAQKRAGVPHPQFVARRPGTGWPQPILSYLRGDLSEAELVLSVRDGDDDYESEPHTSTQERLCEALYYVGQAHWAQGRPEVARNYFTALVNLRVLYFVEHGLALAEIDKLNRGTP